MASEHDSNKNDTKLPAKPTAAAAAGGGNLLSRMPSLSKMPSLSRMPSITAPGVGSGPTWFKSLDLFRSTDSATGILRDEVFKSDVSFDIAALESAATASSSGGANNSMTAAGAFPPPPLPLSSGGAGAFSRNQSTNSTASQDSWLRKMLNPSQDNKGTTTAAAAAPMVLPPLGQLARNTSTSSSSQSSSLLLQKVYDASKSAIARICTSTDWAPPDLTSLPEPMLVNVADVFKTSNEINNIDKTMFFADVATSMSMINDSSQQQQPHEELAAALKLANALPTTARHARAKATAAGGAAAASSENSCYADFMKEMQAACAPAAATTTKTVIAPPSASGTADIKGTVKASGTSRRLKNPLPVTASSSGAAAAASEQENKKPSRKRKQSDEEDDDVIYVEPTDKDVLMGRGGRTNNHPGNKEYLKVKDQMQKRYMEASKQDKTPISQELVDKVHGWGGRFLQPVADNKWYEVDPVTARKKCSQTLREINTPEVRKAKRSKYSKA